MEELLAYINAEIEELKKVDYDSEIVKVRLETLEEIRDKIIYRDPV